MKWLKNRPSLIICEHDLQSIIHYTDIGDRAIIQFRQGCANGRITEILPTGLKVRIWDGEMGTIQFYRWYNIIEVRKLKVTRKVDYTSLRNKIVILSLITLLIVGSFILFSIERHEYQNKKLNKKLNQLNINL